jgi:hypothetical protein
MKLYFDQLPNGAHTLCSEDDDSEVIVLSDEAYKGARSVMATPDSPSESDWIQAIGYLLGRDDQKLKISFDQRDLLISWMPDPDD